MACVIMSVYTAPLVVEPQIITTPDDMYCSVSELQCGGAFLCTHQLNAATKHVAATVWTCVLGSHRIPLCNVSGVLVAGKNPWSDRQPKRLMLVLLSHSCLPVQGYFQVSRAEDGRASRVSRGP